TRLHADDIYRALGKLHGVARMRMAYMRAPRFSDRRLITGLKNRDDAATVDLLVVGPDQAMASIPEPSDAALQDHFEKYKTTRPSEGEFGIGYLLPDRVKIAWMTIDRTAIQG